MTRHLCTGCHGDWRSARCRPRHGASCIGLEDTRWPGWRTKTVWAAPRWRSALKIAPRRRMWTLIAPRWCHVTELAPRRHRAVWAAPRWRSALRIAPRRRTCSLAAPRWCSASELAPRRHKAAPRWTVPVSHGPRGGTAMAYLCVSRATMVHVHAGGTTMALCPEDCATTAHVDVDCTTVVPCH